MRSRFALTFGIGALSSIIMLGAYAAFAWTGPSGSPPNNNVSAPINVSSAGQVKAGDFATQGKLGAGTPSPNAGYNLDVYKTGWKAYFHGTDGGVSIGPLNSGWVHIYSDSSTQPFIFNTDVYTTTNAFSSYDNDLLLKRAGTARLTIGANAVTIGGGSSSNWAQLNVPGTNSIQVNGAIYSYGSGGTGICVGESTGSCTGTGGTALKATGIRFPDGTLQTTAATASVEADTLATVTGRGNTTNTGVYLNGQAFLQNGSPTIYLMDTDHRSAMIHNNSNLFYVLRGCGNNSSSWCTAANGWWPFIINLEDNSITMGGALTTYDYTASTYFLDRNDGTYYADPNGTSQMNVVTANSFLYRSDARLKNDIAPLQGALQKLLQIGGIEFTWNDGAKKGERDIGVIAQDVEKVLPEAVSTGADGLKAVDYARLVPVLINAIREQQEQIDFLKAEIERIK